MAIAVSGVGFRQVRGIIEDINEDKLRINYCLFGVMLTTVYDFGFRWKY